MTLATRSANRRSYRLLALSSSPHLLASTTPFGGGCAARATRSWQPWRAASGWTKFPVKPRCLPRCSTKWSEQSSTPLVVGRGGAGWHSGSRHALAGVAKELGLHRHPACTGAKACTNVASLLRQEPTSYGSARSARTTVGSFSLRHSTCYDCAHLLRLCPQLRRVPQLPAPCASGQASPTPAPGSRPRPPSRRLGASARWPARRACDVPRQAGACDVPRQAGACSFRQCEQVCRTWFLNQQGHAHEGDLQPLRSA